MEHRVPAGDVSRIVALTVQVAAFALASYCSSLYVLDRRSRMVVGGSEIPPIIHSESDDES